MLAQLAYALFFVASRSTALILGVSAVLVLLQDTMIFPSAELYLVGARPKRDPASLPEGIESFMMPNEAGAFEVWRMKAPLKGAEPKRIAIIAKGNGGTIDSMLTFHEWFKAQGLTSYSVEYRGYGRSNGWPTQAGILRDMKRLWSFALKEEGVKPSQVVVFGQSLGTGPAAYLASLYNPAALVLLSPYTSIDDVVRDRPRLNVLAPFVWSRFPSKEYIVKLADTCVIAAHGEQDHEIRSHHTPKLQELYRGRAFFAALLEPEAHHGDIFDRTYPKIESELGRCFARS